MALLLMSVACFVNPRKGLDSSDNTSSAKVSVNCENQVPVNLTFTCQAQVTKTLSGAVYSLVDSNCQNIQIDPSTGKILAEKAFLTMGQTCQFKVQLAVSGKVVSTSEEMSLTGTSKINATLSVDQIHLKKAGGSKTVRLNFASPIPFDTNINYSIWGKAENSIPFSELSTTGGISVQKGDTWLDLDFSIPSGSSFTGADNFFVDLYDFSPRNIRIAAYENEVAMDQVSLGRSHTCGISAGSLYCWGNNDYGQIGNGSEGGRVYRSLRIGSDSDWSRVATGEHFSCGVRGGMLFCWGRNKNGQIGNGTASLTNVLSPSQVGVAADWQELSAGKEHVCAIKTNGELHCWGNDSFQQVGNGVAVGNVTSPERIAAGILTPWTQVSLGGTHSCGVNNTEIYCWGNDGYGQLGNGIGVSPSDTPLKIVSAGPWTDVSSGENHSCGIMAGDLFCWGRNLYGQVGNGSTGSQVQTPEWINSVTGWTQVSSGGEHSCGVASNELYCWGRDIYGQLGLGGDKNASSPNVTSPTKLPIESITWNKVASGFYHSCAIESSKLYCWGDDTSGQLGFALSKADTILSPYLVDNESWSKVTLGLQHACGIKNQKLYCWGWLYTGQDSSNPNPGFIKQVGEASNWDQVASSSLYSCGIASGSLYCWGNPSFGVMGGAASPYNTPSKLPDEGWQKVCTGDGSACGIRNNELYCWGSDSVGQAGNGASTGTVSTPEKISNDSDWTDVYCGGTANCALRSGNLFCWGDDTNLLQGNGATTGIIESPQPVGGLTNWSKLSIGSSHICGIESNNLYCWGKDTNGALGNGAGATDYDSPTQVGDPGLWQDIAVGAHSCGIRDGKLYCWGGNDKGQMGIPSVSNADAPTQVGSSDQWSQISLGVSFSCGVESGNLYCFGNNDKEQIKKNVQFTVPTLIGY